MKMKLSVFLCCCFILLLKYKTVNGGLVGNFFEDVHDAAKKVRQDVRGVLHLNNDGKNKNGGDGKDVVVSTTTIATVAKEASTSTTAASNNSASKSVEKPEAETTTAASIPTTTPTSGANVTTTEMEERTALDAPCRSGYKHTPDGACEQAF